MALNNIFERRIIAYFQIWHGAGLINSKTKLSDLGLKELTVDTVVRAHLNGRPLGFKEIIKEPILDEEISAKTTISQIAKLIEEKSCIRIVDEECRNGEDDYKYCIARMINQGYWKKKSARWIIENALQKRPIKNSDNVKAFTESDSLERIVLSNIVSEYGKYLLIKIELSDLDSEFGAFKVRLQEFCLQ